MPATLDNMLIADPKESVAQLLADQCVRLAERRVVVTSAQELLEKAREMHPKAILFALELPKSSPKALIPQLLEAAPNGLLLATYRELSVPDMQRLGDLGVEEFVSYPVDILQVYRAASRHFNAPFRRHDRFNVTLEVYRADGVLIGHTCDLSEGGMCLVALHPMTTSESLLVDLAVPDGQKPLRVRCHILGVDGEAPTQVRARVQFTKLWGPEQRRLVDYLQARSDAVASNAG